ncbi:MAG TPA: hypothetical protein VF701_15445 [Thermoanaerobaculia bacterium]
MKESSRRDQKKPYEQPKVTRFPLRPEEAVLGFCKSNTGSGPSGGGCFFMGACAAAGS